MDQRKCIGWPIAALQILLIGCGIAAGGGGSGIADSLGSVLDSVAPPIEPRAHVIAVDTLTSAPFTAASVPTHVRLANGLAFDLRIPHGYELKVAAEGMERARFIALSPDGRLFITDMKDQTDNRQGKVYILDGWDERAARFTVRHTYLSGSHNPNQVAFSTTSKDTAIYVATTDRLLRYPFHRGDTVPSGAALVIDTFPAYSTSHAATNWHLTRSVAVHGDKIYVSVGSSCDVCIEKESVRASIIEMNLDGSDRWIYASGLRNSVGLEWVMGDLFATNMGRDNLGDDAPEDKLQIVQKDHFYGWPYFYQSGEKVYRDTTIAEPNAHVHAPEPAYMALGPHTGPLGFDFLHGFHDPGLDNTFIVALHGSSTVATAKGDALVRVRRGDPIQRIVDGFHQGAHRYGRPCDVLMRDADSFWFTDDQNGVLYLLRRKK